MFLGRRNLIATASRTARQFSTAPRKSPLIIGGQHVQSKSDKWFEVRNPATQEVVTLVPQATPAELQSAADAAQTAFYDWRRTSVSNRQRVMFKYL
ncbi:MAG: hypothetical protein MHM6MM_006076, partial [Cercozoa sp. M6MM]